EKVTFRNEMMVVILFLESFQGVLHAPYGVLWLSQRRINQGQKKMQRAIVPAFRSFPFHYRKIAPCLGRPNLICQIPIVIDDNVCIHQFQPGPKGAWKYLFMYAPLEPHVRS